VFAELLTEKLAGIVRLSPDQVASLENHYQLLVRWNRVLNLTSVRSLEEVVERHYCESLFLGVHLPPGRLHIADIGSGAGFPGIPVAVLRPDCLITLIESHARKAVFLRESSRILQNIRIAPQRAENIKERFDVAVSRAVSYVDLRPILKKIGHRADLLTGGEGPPPELGFDWQEGIPLPWGRQRFLRIGVSRET
jgi:16S rRNA (guanine(527)-N(7))-methyltransferase RsmG